MRRKFLKASLASPSVIVEVDLPPDELSKATIITQARREMVYNMRKALEKKMAELSEDDLTFTLEERDL